MILTALRKSRRGSTVAEFALVLTPLLTLLSGGVEAGNLAYSKSVIEGSLRVAARMATTGKYSADDIDAYVRGRLLNIGIKGTDVTITRKSYASFDSVSKPEPLTSDVAPLGGTPSKGDCYIDLNNDKAWSTDSGSNGNGQSEDILYYGVTVDYKLLFGFMSSALGATQGHMSLKANTVVKNEPFGEERTPPVERCIA